MYVEDAQAGNLRSLFCLLFCAPHPESDKPGATTVPKRAIRLEGFGCTTSAALQLETGNTLETERNGNKTHN